MAPKEIFRQSPYCSEFMACDLMSLTGEDIDYLGEHGMALVTNEAMVWSKLLT